MLSRFWGLFSSVYTAASRSYIADAALELRTQELIPIDLPALLDTSSLKNSRSTPDDICWSVELVGVLTVADGLDLFIVCVGLNISDNASCSLVGLNMFSSGNTSVKSDVRAEAFVVAMVCGLEHSVFEAFAVGCGLGSRSSEGSQDPNLSDSS